MSALPQTAPVPLAPAAPIGLPSKPTLQMIQRLESKLRAFDQVSIEPVHYFAPGMYGREITVPAGVCIVGKLHRHTHLIMLMSGDVTIYTDAGMQRLQGPKTWVSQAGTKRAIYAHAESIIVTLHATDETDLDALEAAIIEPETPALDIDGGSK